MGAQRDLAFRAGERTLRQALTWTEAHQVLLRMAAEKNYPNCQVCAGEHNGPVKEFSLDQIWEKDK